MRRSRRSCAQCPHPISHYTNIILTTYTQQFSRIVIRGRNKGRRLAWRLHSYSQRNTTIRCQDNSFWPLESDAQ